MVIEFHHFSISVGDCIFLSALFYPLGWLDISDVISLFHYYCCFLNIFSCTFAFLCYMYSCITCIPMLHVFMRYTYSPFTHIPSLNVFPRYTYSGVTCIHMYSCITCILPLHVITCYMYSCITHIPSLHLFPHYMYSLMTCIPRCYQINSYSPIAAGGWSVMFHPL